VHLNSIAYLLAIWYIDTKGRYSRSWKVKRAYF